MRLPVSVLLFLGVLGRVDLLAQIPDRTEAEAGDTIVDPYHLEGVLVEVTRARQALARIPQSVSIVGEQQIQLGQRQVTIDEALRSVPGVFAANRNNFTVGEGVRLNIRAPQARIGTRGIQLLQDGIPLTTADGTTLPNNLDLGSAGRIEVIRGPNSVLYGNSAGGVISVETQFPSTRPFVLNPEIQFGSFGYNRQQIKAEGTTGALGYVVNVNRMETDGFRRYGGAEIRRANVVTRALLSERTIVRGIFNLYDMPFAENPSTLTREDALDNPTTVREAAFDGGWGKSVTQGQGGVHLEHDFTEGHVVRALGWGMWRDNWNPIPGQIIGLDRTAAGVRSEYDGERQIGSRAVRWTTGFDVSYQRDDRNEFANEGVATPGGRAREGALRLSQRETVLSLGPFAQGSLLLREDLGLTAGFRYDRYRFEAHDHFLFDGDQSGERDLSAATPMVGATYTPTPGVNLFANYASAYQTPTTVELSNRPDGLGGFNQELEPEYVRSFEAGARGAFSDWRIRYEIAAYTSRVENALIRFEGVDEQIFFRNAGESSRDGVEVALEWAPVQEVQARLAYTYQDFTFVRYEVGGIDYSGNREPGAPPHSLFLGITHNAPFGLTSALDLRWVDSYAVDDANTESNWSYTVVDLRFGLDVDWERTRVRPFVGIENVFDERYNASVTLNAIGARYFEPSPGRSIYLGLSASAGS